MAKYPVEISDKEGIVDGLNYVLSGPAGLGQNFAGFSESETGYLTGNNRLPYTRTTITPLYVAPIALSTAELLDPRTLLFTFATPQGSPPFKNGQPVEIVGSSVSWYDGTYSAIGVVNCTVNDVTVRLSGPEPDPGVGTGGTIGTNVTNSLLSTDCNGRVTVTGATDRVFINAQLDSIVSYITPTPSPLRYTVQVNRYVGSTNADDPANPDYIFNLDEKNPNSSPLVAEKAYYIPTLDPTVGRVTTLAVTSGTNHLARNTYKSNYVVNPTVTSGSGSLLSIEIELKPSVTISDVGLSSGGPYFGPAQTPTPYRTEPWNEKIPTAVSESAGILTITVTNSAPAFTVGQSVKLSGADPYDGVYKIITATPTYIEVETAVTGAATLSSPKIVNPFFNTTITILSGGQEFEVGDTLLIKGSQIGGVDGTNDMELEVVNVSVDTPVVLDPFDTVFTSIIDAPGPGYYWYILEIEFDTLSGDAVMTKNEFNYRGLSAQVVKE